MERGDLSNRPSPRLIVVFEGAIGILSSGNKKAYEHAVKKENWKLAISLFDLQDLMMRKILDLTWRENYNVQIVTWMGEKAALAIDEIMDEENIPVRGCFSSTPSRLSRDLAYNPDILAVYDPDPDNRFTYGSKGVFLVDPFQIGRIFGG